MITATVLSGLGQTPAAIRASQRARFSTQARQRAAIDYNIRTWPQNAGGNINRQRIVEAQRRMSRERAARREPTQPPSPMEMAAGRRRREEATKRTSARLRRMFAPAFGPGAGQRVIDPSRREQPGLSARSQRAEDARIRARARAISRSRWEPEVQRRIAAAQAEGLRRRAEPSRLPPVVPPPIETIPPMETAPVFVHIPDREPATITTQATPETLDIARREAATRQSTEALQRLVNARRALGIR